MTDDTGAVIARYDYLPFGEPWDPQPSPDVRQFAGKERDAETGLDYFGARYYRAQSGRFTTIDPVLNVDEALTDPQRWNRYSYAVNRPLTMIDPDGREAGYLYLPNGQMVAPIKGMTSTMAKLWGGTVVAGAVIAAGPVAWRTAVNCFLSASCQSSAIDILEGAAGAPSRIPGAGNRASVATVEELVTMMNKRTGVIAEFATGDAAAYLERIGAEGAHMLLEGGQSNILLRADVATRRTALHEWLHRMLQKQAHANRTCADHCRDTSFCLNATGVTYDVWTIRPGLVPRW